MNMLGAALRLVAALASCGMAVGAAAGSGAPMGSNVESAAGLASAVTWTSELSLGRLLAQERVVRSHADLAGLLAKRWYTGVDVQAGSPRTVRRLASCGDLFALKRNNRSIQARRSQEASALQELVVMCEAVRLLSGAQPAQRSAIPSNPLGADLPQRLPKAFALVTSQAERARIANDRNLGSWADVNRRRSFKSETAHRSLYVSDDGVQTVMELGRGDVDGDQWEDLLVAVSDAVEGGSYFDVRLFVLTATPEGYWKVITP